jgi:hypothetical protein
MMETTDGRFSRLNRRTLGVAIAGVAGSVILVILATQMIGAGTPPEASGAFPVLDRESTTEDVLPRTADQLLESEMMAIQEETARLLAQVGTDRYFLAESERDAVCLIYAHHDREPFAGCTVTPEAIEKGVLLVVSSEGGPALFALALPGTYDEVADQEGRQV